MKIIATLQALNERVSKNKQAANRLLTALPDAIRSVEEKITGERERLVCVSTGQHGEVKVTTWIAGYGSNDFYIKVEATKQGLLRLMVSEGKEDLEEDELYDPSLIDEKDLARLVLRQLEITILGYVNDYDEVSDASSKLWE